MALLPIFLAGCGGTPQATPAAPTVTPATEATPTANATSSPAPTPSPSPTVARTTRGNVVKKVGETAWVRNNDGSTAVTLVVKSIQVDPVCTSGVVEKSKSGHLVVLDVDVETTPALADHINKQFLFAIHGWKVIAENGTTANGKFDSFEAFACFPDTEKLPDIIGPAERATGKVVLDVPTATGILINDPEGAGGWEWEYPAK